MAKSPRPNPGVIAIHKGDASGAVVAEVKTTSDGRFTADLPPGTYTLILKGGGAGRTVDVVKGEYANVDIVLNAF